jgi:peptide/nickel transport system ATP-binding protein
VTDLSVEYRTPGGVVKALDGVSFEMRPGEVLGVVGETGCGKSTLASAIPRLLPEPPALVRSGRIEFGGRDLLTVPRWQMPQVRGTAIGMVLQEPLNSLNPAFRVYEQLVEAIRVRRAREKGTPSALRIEPGRFDYGSPPRDTAAASLSKMVAPSTGPLAHRPARAPESSELREEALEYLRLVRINDPERVLRLYPHELSGGMRQRVMIAMALSERPALLIADEPTSALDVTIQAQVLTLMKELMDEVNTSILFISHDLGVIAEIADRVGVMYAGTLVEFGTVHDVFERPQHPYTAALLRSIPSGYKSDGPLPSLTGAVPNLAHPPPGCPFHPRCPMARPECQVGGPPPLRDAPGDHRVLPGHKTACLYAEEMPPGR